LIAVSRARRVTTDVASLQILPVAEFLPVAETSLGRARQRVVASMKRFTPFP